MYATPKPLVGQRVLDPTFHFENTAIIKPPEIEKHNFKVTRVLIDSRERNTKLFANPASYELNLNQEIDDAVAATILVADVPHTAYLVNKNNNELTVEVGTEVFTIEVPFGNYTPKGLGDALKLALNDTAQAAGATIVFDVEYVELTDKYVFTATTVFSFVCNGEDQPYGDMAEMKVVTDSSGNLVKQIIGPSTTPYKPKSIAKMLGLPRTTVQSDSTGRLEAPFRKNFNDSDVIVMHIEHMRLFQSTTTHVNKSILVLHNQKSMDLSLYSSNTEYRATFSPPIPRLNRIKVTFYNAWGDLYDFQNFDHRFELLIESSKQKNKYSL